MSEFWRGSTFIRLRENAPRPAEPGNRVRDYDEMRVHGSTRRDVGKTNFLLTSTITRRYTNHAYADNFRGPEAFFFFFAGLIK